MTRAGFVFPLIGLLALLAPLALIFGPLIDRGSAPLLSTPVDALWTGETFGGARLLMDGPPVFGALLHSFMRVALFAGLVAAPLAIAGAIGLAQANASRAGRMLRAGLDIIAGLPGLVFLLFALLWFEPGLRRLGAPFHSAAMIGGVIGFAIAPRLAVAMGDALAGGRGPARLALGGLAGFAALMAGATLIAAGAGAIVVTIDGGLLGAATTPGGVTTFMLFAPDYDGPLFRLASAILLTIALLSLVLGGLSGCLLRPQDAPRAVSGGQRVWLIAPALLAPLIALALVAASAAPAMQRTVIALPVTLEPAAFGDPETPWTERLRRADMRGLTRDAMAQLVGAATGAERRAAGDLFATADAHAQLMAAITGPEMIGREIVITVNASGPAADRFAAWRDGAPFPEGLTDRSRLTLVYADRLAEAGALSVISDASFLYSGGNRQDAPTAGLGGALWGSILMLLVAAALALPLMTLLALGLMRGAVGGRLSAILSIAVRGAAFMPPIAIGFAGFLLWLFGLGLPRMTALLAGLSLAPLLVLVFADDIARQIGRLRAAGMAALTGMTTVRIFVSGVLSSIAIGLGVVTPFLAMAMLTFLIDPPRGLLDPMTPYSAQVFMWLNDPSPLFTVKAAAGAMALALAALAVKAVGVLIRPDARQT